MNKDNGGPAFPFVEPNTECNVSEGMTLRDYLAANAMQAMVATEYQSQVNCKKWAAEAYEMADAMLKARKQ